VFYDRDFRYQIWNPYMEKLTGLRAELMLGSFAGANLAWGEPNLMNILNRAMRGETISRKNVAYQIWQTGKKGNYEAVYAPHVNIEGTVIGVIAFILEGAPKTREKEEHQRALLMEQKQRQLAEGLGRIILAMSALPSLPTLLELICGEAAAFLEMDSAQIWLLEGNALIGAAASGLRETSISDLYVSLSETDHLVVQVFETKRPIFLYDLLEDSHMIHSGLSGIFQVRSMVGVPLLIAGQAVGVLLLIDTRRPHYFNADELETILYLGSQAAMAVENARLFSSLQEAQQKIVQAYDATLTGWAKALELRDRDTEGHTQRVVEMTLKLAQAFGMSGEELVHVYRGALLHDIGKMGIPDNILRKPGTLDEGEWKIMRDHPSFAYEMLKPIDYLDHALDIPYCHHEKWNGTGYPRGLKGEEIPLAARIFAVVDVWDALSFDRPYRKALPPDLIFDYIRAESGKHFDPQVVEKFLETFGPPRTPDILQGISIPA
ncbi:MAG TPA: HD domain-containing phosphohydrolase, partial [Anaerolineales bacterium]|nr:HD domain-containing phosphohydrolase [Anaerolineales bacterium]